VERVGGSAGGAIEKVGRGVDGKPAEVKLANRDRDFAGAPGDAGGDKQGIAAEVVGGGVEELALAGVDGGEQGGGDAAVGAGGELEHGEDLIGADHAGHAIVEAVDGEAEIADAGIGITGAGGGHAGSVDDTVAGTGAVASNEIEAMEAVDTVVKRRVEDRHPGLGVKDFIGGRDPDEGGDEGVDRNGTQSEGFDPHHSDLIGQLAAAADLDGMAGEESMAEGVTEAAGEAEGDELVACADGLAAREAVADIAIGKAGIDAEQEAAGAAGDHAGAGGAKGKAGGLLVIVLSGTAGEVDAVIEDFPGWGQEVGLILEQAGKHTDVGEAAVGGQAGDIGGNTGAFGESTGGEEADHLVGTVEVVKAIGAKGAHGAACIVAVMGAVVDAEVAAAEALAAGSADSCIDALELGAEEIPIGIELKAG